MIRSGYKQFRSLEQLRKVMKTNSVLHLYIKYLSPNDNSKNQVYLGGDFGVLKKIPHEEVAVDTGSKGSVRDRFKAGVRFSWLSATNEIAVAPNCKLILYPKYPEVRMSGFLSGCRLRPSDLMAKRLDGRILFLGVTEQASILGHVIDRTNPVYGELEELFRGRSYSVLSELPLPGSDESRTSREILLTKLGQIHRDGWIDSCRIRSGEIVPYTAANGGGYTLEASFGIAPNGSPLPDFLDWELKQYKVSAFDRLELSKAITLFTPEPSGGVYRDAGVEAFIREFGYPDKTIPDRLNFGGVHRVGTVTSITGLEMKLRGYGLDSSKIEDSGGAIVLLDQNERVAAEWSFSKLMNHWVKKHSNACYVPSMSREREARQYWFGNIVELGEGTDFLIFLRAAAAGKVYYDPGIKMENESGQSPRIKKRSQFRIKKRDLPSLYKSFEQVDTNCFD